MDIEKVTPEDFKQYVNIQKSGVVNMWDIKFIISHTDLTELKCFDIMKNYKKYNEGNF